MKLFALVAFVGVLVAGHAQAGWYTTIEDEIFSGGKKAMLIGEISPDAFVVADCVSGERLSFGYAEIGEWKEGYSTLTARILIKVDGGQVHELVGAASERNSTYFQFVATEADMITPVLKDIGGAKKPILVGIEVAGSDNKHSATIHPSGSTKAIKQFMEACGLK